MNVLYLNKGLTLNVLVRSSGAGMSRPPSRRRKPSPAPYATAHYIDHLDTRPVHSLEMGNLSHKIIDKIYLSIVIIKRK